MTKSTENPKVDAVIERADTWQAEYRKLRAIALDCELTEELKWGWPCYALGKANVVLIHGFKDYCAYLFFKGALMQDPANILIQQTDNVQAGRQVRFTGLDQISGMENMLKAYIQDAIEVEKAGLKVEFKKATEFAMPDEFRDKLADMPALKTAFEALTPGRQKAYLLYFSQAKQSKTRVARIEKYVQPILNGKGLDD